MLLVTTEQIAGRNVELLGIVEGSSIQTVHAGKDIMNSLKRFIKSTAGMVFIVTVLVGIAVHIATGDDGESQKACNR